MSLTFTIAIATTITVATIVKPTIDLQEPSTCNQMQLEDLRPT